MFSPIVSFMLAAHEIQQSHRPTPSAPPHCKTERESRMKIIILNAKRNVTQLTTHNDSETTI